MSIFASPKDKKFILLFKNKIYCEIVDNRHFMLYNRVIWYVYFIKIYI